MTVGRFHTMFYAGIGSRETPPDVLRAMTNWAYRLDSEGWILRSGGAPGADSAFEAGAGPDSRIYLPWAGFEGRDGIVCGDDPSLAAVAETYHPAWGELRQGAKRLMTRNVAQILGYGAERAPSMFVLCWTPGGKAGGGTGQAIRIANDYKIPVFDLAIPGEHERFDSLLQSGVL